MSAQEDNGEITGRSSRHSCQMSFECQDRSRTHRLFATQRRVHVKTAEILADRLQFL